MRFIVGPLMTAMYLWFRVVHIWIGSKAYQHRFTWLVRHRVTQGPRAVNSHADQGFRRYKGRRRRERASCQRWSYAWEQSLKANHTLSALGRGCVKTL